MFLTIYDIEPFKNFFDLIFDTTQIVEFKLNEEMLSISLLNNSHVAFYNAEFKKDFFEVYDVDGMESVLVFVDDFYKILKSSSKKDVLTLSSEDASLICTFEHDGNRRVFELPLAEEYGDTPTPPSVPYDCEFQLELVDLKQPCVDLDKIIKTDKFKMITKDGSLFIVSPDDVMTKYSQELKIDSNESVQSIVNIDYISQLQKLNKISDVITLKLGTDKPVGWNIASVGELISIGGLIAPIFEEE